MKKYKVIYAVYSFRRKDISNEIFSKIKDAKDSLRNHAYDGNPLIMKEVIKGYKVIPIEVSYVVPKLNQ